MRELSHRRVIRYLLVLFSIFSVISTVNAAEEYKSDVMGFTFTVPNGWIKGSPNGAANDKAASIYFPGKYFKEYLWVSADAVPVGADVEFQTDVFPMRFQETLTKSTPTLQFSQPERTEVAGCKAWKLSSEANRLGSVYRTKMWLMIHRRQMYCITWTDNPDKSHPKDVEEVISSFRFTLDENATEEYKNPSKGYSFTIASGWFRADKEKIGRSDISVYYPSEGDLEKFTIGIEFAHKQQKIDFPQKLYSMRMQQIMRTSLPDAVFELAEQSEVGEKGAWIFRFKTRRNEVEIQTTIHQVLVGDYVYNFEWTSYLGKSHRDATDGMLKSIKFHPINSSDLGTIEGQTYRNADKGFSLVIPENWKRGGPADAGEAVVMLLAPDGSRSNLNVIVKSVQDHQTKEFLDDKFSDLIQRDIGRVVPGARIQVVQKAAIGGNPAWKYSIEYKLRGLDIRGTVWQVIDRGRIYTITYTDKPTSIVPKEVDEIIESFRFISR